MKYTPFQRVTVGAAVAAILGTFAGYSPSVHSAEAAADAGDELAEVTVTGSRIQRRDAEANSPLVTVDSATLENRSGVNIESYLNQLPAYNPAASPTVKGGAGGNTDVQISSINSVGIATISLRGFGPNRSLVLVDGRRAVPTNSMMQVDINGIPSAMIRSVEIISGGASATYGADAIAGVSNFLLRRNFEGLEVDTQYGVTDAGDGEEFRASLMLGTEFADSRGHIVLATEYYDRKAAYEKNRDFYTNAWKDPSVGGNFLGFVFGANGYNTLSNVPRQATLAGLLNVSPTTTQVYPNPGTGASQGIRFFENGALYVPFGPKNWNSFPTSKIDDFAYSNVNVYDNTKCNTTNAASCASGPSPTTQAKYNEVEGYASSPQTRFSFMAAGDYDITDKIHFASSARFAQSVTETFLSGTNASFGWEVSVPYNAAVDSPVVPQGTPVGGTPVNWQLASTVAAYKANPGAYANPGFIGTGKTGAQHPVTPEMAILLNSRPVLTYCLQTTPANPACSAPNFTPTTNPALVGQTNVNTGPTLPWVMETFPLDSFGRRATNNTNTVWQIEAGLTFDLPVKDWTAEVYYSRGETATYNVAYGNNSLARWRGMVLAPDYGRNANLQSNLTHNGPGANPGFGSVAVPCTTGFYETIFNGDAVPSADCQYAVQAPLQTHTQNEQDIFELNLQGGLFSLPAGEVRGAAGFQQRRNNTQFNPDILQSTASFTDQVIGVYPTGYMNAQMVAKDIWAEALIPILADLPLLQKVELELGFRSSDYDKTEGAETFKINANIQVNDYVRFRGGFNRATRAPNLGELFLPLQQVFTGNGVYGDPCGLISNSPFGAAGAAPNPIPAQGGQPGLASGQTQAGANSAYMICQAQMGSAGASNFYTSQQPGAAGGGFAWVNQIGNANLTSETADTWTAGVILRSPFEGPLLRGMQATIDWYQISLEDTILPYSIDYARYRCYGAVQVANAAEAAAQAATTACTVLPRSQQNGGSLTTLVSFDNQATVNTRGVDFTFDWSTQFEDMGLSAIPGGLNLSVQGTWLDAYKTKQSPAAYDPAIDWKGSLGPNLQGFQAGAFDYRLMTSLAYTLPSVSFSLRWRHYPETAVAAKAQENAIKANNAAVAAGSGGTRLSYTPISNYNVKQYDQFDLSGFWTINDMLSLRFGIDNVLDVQPASTGRTGGRPYDASLTAAQNSANMAAVCGGAPGCQNPTAYSYANSGAGTTSGGYYDVLGRRYYIGLKARF